MTTRTLSILEALVDIVAIIGLVVLASLRVVDGDAVLPLITLVAGGSIGARVAGRKRPPISAEIVTEGVVPGPTTEDEKSDGISHSSILAIAFFPLLQLFMNQAVRAVVTRTILLIVFALSVVYMTACGGNSTLPATLWRLTRGACSIVVALPEGADPEAEPGVKALRVGEIVDGGPGHNVADGS